MAQKTIVYDDPSRFLEDYEQHLTHGALSLDWTDAPSVETSIKLTLCLFPDGNPVVVKGVIAKKDAEQAHIALDALTSTQRAALGQSAEFCRNILGKMSQPEMPSVSSVPSTPPSNSRFTPTSSPALPRPPLVSTSTVTVTKSPPDPPSFDRINTFLMQVHLCLFSFL